MGVEIISILPMGAILLLFSIIGSVLGVARLWEDGFLIGLTVSLPVRFLTRMAMSSMSSWRKLSAGLPTALLTTIMFLMLSQFLSSVSCPTFIQVRVFV